MAVYDAFLFYNEIELLELRMRILDPYVDYFVVSECDHTFSGNKKDFNFEKNKEKFSKYADKIIYIKNIQSEVVDINILLKHETNEKKRADLLFIKKVYDAAKNDWNEAPHWSRDFLHREFVRFGLANCRDDDVVIFGDLDEIPSPDAIGRVKALLGEEIFCCEQDMYYYTLNLKVDEIWRGTRIALWKSIKDKALNSLRVNYAEQVMIKSAGWHFSFFGGEERVKSKIKDYGHQEYNTNKVHSEVHKKILHGRDVLGRNKKLIWVPISTKHPKVVFESSDEYIHFQSPKPKINILNLFGYYIYDSLRKIKSFFS
ncbi:hypothetical protein G6733_01750 [Polynucleobacter paneuropaeus]|nr:hypothetical protein G6733_01750 [Polynucleobacter paneuropaeus]